MLTCWHADKLANVADNVVDVTSPSAFKGKAVETNYPQHAAELESISDEFMVGTAYCTVCVL